MGKPTHKVAAASAAALLAAGLVVGAAGAASASAPADGDRITSTTQLKDSIQLAVAQEQQTGTGELSDIIGGRVTGLYGPDTVTC